MIEYVGEVKIMINDRVITTCRVSLKHWMYLSGTTRMD